MKAVALLIGRVKNGVLLYSLISIGTQKFGMAHAKVLHLWSCKCSAWLDGLIISLEINSWENETGRNPNYFMKDVSMVVNSKNEQCSKNSQDN